MIAIVKCSINIMGVKASYSLYSEQSTSPALLPSSPHRLAHQPRTGQNCRGDAESETGWPSASGLEQSAPDQGNYSHRD